MKNSIIILIVCFLMLFLSACNEPDALVVNTVFEDGSVTRTIILTSLKDNFDLDNCQVPVSDSWDIEKVTDISEEGDTTWTLTAIKHFENVDELNMLYQSYEGSNGGMKRQAVLKKRFLWFNTEYYFAETIEKAIEGYAPEEFMNEEQLNYFYMPDEIEEREMEGPDSTRVKEIIEAAGEVYDEWLGKSLIKQLCLDVIDLTGTEVSEDSIDTILSMEYELDIFDMDEDTVIDILFGEGFYSRNEVMVDSAMSILEERFDVAFSADSYLIQTEMPGELTSTNGYIDSENNVLWKVDGEVFLSKDYEMWAESKVRNTWAWIVSGLFLLFIIAGLIYRVSK